MMITDLKLNYVLFLLAGILFNSSVFSQREADRNSYYEGYIKAQGQEILTWISILNEGTDSLRATMDIPEQSVFDKEVGDFTIDGKEVTFTIKAFASSFKGTFTDNHKMIEGTWTQGGKGYPMDCHLLKEKPELKRPQEPREPFPYRSEDITFENPSAKIKLAGTLTIPENSSDAPTVILVSGSGPQNRNSNLLGHKRFLVISDYLTRKGIAVLRYDERGIGESEGKFSTATTFDLAEDVLSAYQYLRNNKAIDPRKIGIIGHSEGGMIAPIVASKLKDIAFIVMLAGPGTSGEQILYQQSRLISIAEGKSEKQVKKDLRFMSKIYAVVKSDAGYKEGVEQIRKIYKRQTRFMSKKKINENNLGETNRELAIRQVLSPWFREFVKIDPEPYLSLVHCPVLALIGSKDLQVPADPNLDMIKEILESAGNKNVSTKEIPGVNHLFQHCETGSPSEYFKIEETFSEEVMEMITEWILSLKITN